MKTFTTTKLLFLFSIILFLSSCAVTPRYIGDKYPPTYEVDVFYDALDIDRPYRTIGHLLTSDVDYRRKEELIEKAKSVGADGIIIEGFIPETNDSDERVKAVAIRYTD